MSSTTVKIHREAYNRIDLATTFQESEDDEKPLVETIKRRAMKNVQCSGECLKKKTLETLPFINVVKGYKIKKNLLYDILAGINVGIVQIPQSMGFALLASLPPVYGLYCSFFQPLLYFFLAMSQHNSLGTMAVPSLIIGTAVDRELRIIMENRGIDLSPSNGSFTDFWFNTTEYPNGTDIEQVFDEGAQKAAIATTITLLAGLIQIGMAFCRMGAMTTFMPVSFVGGFTTACGFFIASSQLPSIFGIKIPKHAGIFRLIKLMIDVFKNLKFTNPGTIIVSVICLFFLIVMKEVINEKFKDKLKIPIPAELIVVILGTLISYYAKLTDRFGVQNVGQIPKGFPKPVVPPMEFASNVITDAVILAILSFVISISMANIFSKKYKYQVDSNQEMLAYGVMHTVSSFFHCFGGACAPPRSYVFEKSGGRTSAGFLSSVVLLLLVIMVLGYLFQPLPKAVLASVIIVALFPLFKQFKDLALYWKVSKFDFFIWLVSWFFTIITDVGIGLGIGVGYVIISYVLQSLMSKGTVLGFLKDDLVAPETSFSKVKQVMGIRIFRFENNLYFATIQRFKNELFKGTFNPTLKMKEMNNNDNCEVDGADNEAAEDETAHKNGSATDLNGTKEVDKNDDIRHIILDCSRFSFIDMMGINILKQVSEDFSLVGVDICLINCAPEFRERLKKVGLLAASDGPFVEYPTIQDALAILSSQDSCLNDNESSM